MYEIQINFQLYFFYLKTIFTHVNFVSSNTQEASAWIRL